MKRMRLLAVILDGASAADDRRDLGSSRGRAGDLPRREHYGTSLTQTALGERDHLDHALIGLVRSLAEGEDAVLVQDQALDVGLLLEHLGGSLGQPETRRE